MSKASEFKARVAIIRKSWNEINQPIFQKGSKPPLAEVGEEGDLKIKYDCTLSPDEALDFADWLKDTFGEGEGW